MKITQRSLLKAASVEKIYLNFRKKTILKFRKKNPKNLKKKYPKRNYQIFTGRRLQFEINSSIFPLIVDFPIKNNCYFSFEVAVSSNPSLPLNYLNSFFSLPKKEN